MFLFFSFADDNNKVKLYSHEEFYKIFRGLGKALSLPAQFPLKSKIIGLESFQCRKNRAHHKGIHSTSYDAMFRTLKVGLKSSSTPHEALLDINSEEDLEKLYSTETTIIESNLVGFSKNDLVESAKHQT